MVLFGASEFIPPILGCNIKGNISVRGGERIYHIPGQEYYSETRISLLNGERWFCSEEAAREAGWRKAHQ
ncbi:sunset domain-containing protein [Sinorhizobium fredii]|uniref:sunset domain-containing protein n=1 Tax=Rhizobium fredii TaxID=380 RepID=UPI003392241C